MTKSSWESRRRSLKLWISLATLGFACPAGAELGRWTLAQPPAGGWTMPQRPGGMRFVDMPVTDPRPFSHPAVASQSLGGFVDMVVTQPDHQTTGGKVFAQQTSASHVAAQHGPSRKDSLAEAPGQLELSPSAPVIPPQSIGPDVSAVDRAIQKLQHTQLMLAEIPKQLRFVELATNTPESNTPESYTPATESLPINVAVPIHPVVEDVASPTSPLQQIGLTEMELVHSPFDSTEENVGLMELIRRYADLEPNPSQATSTMSPMHLVSLGLPQVPENLLDEDALIRTVEEPEVATPPKEPKGRAEQASDSEHALPIKSEDHPVKSDAASIESLVDKLPAQKAIRPFDAPSWVGQIQFAMLRYAKQRDLSLEDAVHTAIQFAPEIQVLRADVGISEAEITKQDASFDWATFVQSNWDERNVPISSALDGAFNRLENHTLLNSAGVKRQNGIGGAVRLAQDLGFADSNSQFFQPANQANARIALEYQQPLLQGAGLLVNRSRINIAIANAGISQEQLTAGLQNHLLNVINAYWELVAKRGEFVIQKRSYERALETATIVSNRVQLDVGPVQSARSEATVGSRRAAVLAAEYAVVLAQEKLLRLMFGQCFRNSVDAEIIPTSSMLGPSREVEMEMELQLGLQRRPEIRVTLQEIKRTSIEQGVARNQLLPLLGLTMSLSNKGLQGNNGLASAFNDQFNFGDPTYGVGVSYALPVGNRAARANLRQAEIRLCKFQKQFETVVSDVALEIRNAVHGVALAEQQRETTRQALALAQKELDVLKLRAELLLDGDNVGPLYLDNLLESQQRVAIAEQAFLQASTQHALAHFELQRATGALLRTGAIE